MYYTCILDQELLSQNTLYTCILDQELLSQNTLYTCILDQELLSQNTLSWEISIYAGMPSFHQSTNVRKIDWWVDFI
jgi:hypothetical protein